MFDLRQALSALPEGVFADVLENDSAYLVVLDLPGVTEDTVDIEISDTRITVEATRSKAIPAEFEYVEENRRLFIDVELPLPPDATEEGASGSIDRGVLELRLPKREKTERSIPIE